MTIRKVAVLGGGLMGRQIALNTAIYPYEVTLFDANPACLEDVAKWEETYLAGRIAKGRMSQEQVDGIKSRFHICTTLEEAVKDVDLVIEAIVEREDIKHTVFQQVNALVGPKTIITTNSSRMVSSIFKDDITDPSRLANMHYFNPALVMKLVEIVQGEHVSDETIEALMEFCRTTGKTPIHIRKEIDGFVVDRILDGIYKAAYWLVEEGYCSYEDLDTACENGLGHPMGPFRLLDLTGIDLAYDIGSRQYAETGIKPAGLDLVKEFCDKGWYGEKTGRGFYDYSK